MGMFLGKYNLPKFALRETESLKKLITIERMKRLVSIYKNKYVRYTKRITKPNGFTKEFYIIFKDQMIPLVLKLFRSI